MDMHGIRNRSLFELFNLHHAQSLFKLRKDTETYYYYRSGVSIVFASACLEEAILNNVSYS